MPLLRFFSTRSCDARLSNYTITKLPNYKIRSQRGYILLILLLTVALLSIAALKIVQEFKFQYQRDREEELIHRGVQYSRAVRRYYRKLGRYPTRIEDLENTNNIRYIRKRYKDPMNRDPKTGKELDFKFLHMTDVQMSFNSAAPNGTVPVANMAAQQAATQPVQGIAGTAAGAGTAASAVTQEPQPQPGDQNANSQADQEAASAPPPQPLSPTVGANGAPQVFGGGAIVGVASASKAKSIREFNKKDHYNQWQFIYDPTTDRGGLLMTPNQPPLQGSMQNMQQNGPQNGQQPAQPGLPGQPGVTTQPQQPPQNQDTPLQQ
jgi:type II secretory pathway pseudopilin PulG